MAPPGKAYIVAVAMNKAGSDASAKQEAATIQQSCARAIERAQRLLNDGKISVAQYGALVAGDAQFHIEQARFERDELKRKLEEIVNASATIFHDAKSSVSTAASGHTPSRWPSELPSIEALADEAGKLEQMSSFACSRGRGSRLEFADEDDADEDDVDDEHKLSGGLSDSSDFDDTTDADSGFSQEEVGRKSWESLGASLSAPAKPVRSASMRAMLPVLDPNMVVKKRIGLLTPPTMKRRGSSGSSIFPSSRSAQWARSPIGLSALKGVFKGMARTFSKKVDKSSGGSEAAQSTACTNTAAESLNKDSERFRQQMSSSEVSSKSSLRDHNHDIARQQLPCSTEGIAMATSGDTPGPSRMSEQPFCPADFERKRRVGRGGFGTVYLVCKKTEPNKEKCFAMKVLRKDIVLESGSESRALLERNVLRVLKSRFVARLRYAFQTETRLYLLTDFYCGGSLKTMLRTTIPETGGRCHVDAARFYAAELVIALGYLHARGIVHRDVKPSNVLVDRHGHVALCDFGIATITKAATKGRRASQLRRHDSFAGTIEYMAPELLRKDTVGYTAGVDWWALGVLCYEIVTGVTPFYSDTPRDLFLNILRSKPNFDRPLSASSEVQSPTIAEAWGPHGIAFLQGLLTKEVTARLNSADAIKAHPFFTAFDFNLVARGLLNPPYKPVLPNFFTFTDSGTLVCTKNSKLPKLNENAESDYENADECHKERSSGSNGRHSAVDCVNVACNDMAKPGVSSRNSNGKKNGDAFRGFAYAGDTTVVQRRHSSSPP